MLRLVSVMAAMLMVSMVTASMYDVDGSMYNDYLMQDLYKRLAQLQESEGRMPSQDYYYDDEGMQLAKDNWIDGNEIPLESRGAAEIRDQELVAHSAHADGFQYISGGAGEGKQHLTPEGNQENQQEVKTDEHLPFYCHPPNPCPKGFTAEDGCDEFVDDSAEFQRKWIWKMQEKGMCACDEEHMFHCPKESLKSQKVSTDNLDQIIGSLLGDKEEGNNPYAVGNKRESLVAKKSPIVKRSIEDIDAALEKMKTAQKKDSNPYLQGYKISTAAKKGLGYN